jgi:hypothetical protein
MRCNKIVVGFLLTLLVINCSMAWAQGLWETHRFTSDTAWNNFYGGSPIALAHEAFGGEGRAGNGATGGTYEVGINRLNSQGPPPNFQFGAATNDFVWNNFNNVPVNFSLVYSGDVTRNVTWTIGSSTVTLNSLPFPNPPTTNPITHLAIRARATATSRLLMQNLVFNGVAAPVGTVVDSAFTSATNTDYAFFSLPGGSFSSGYTLSGTVTFSWSGARPSNSNMSFQVKNMFFPYSAAPEPDAGRLLCAIGAGLLGAATLRRFHSQKMGE